MLAALVLAKTGVDLEFFCCSVLFLGELLYHIKSSKDGVKHMFHSIRSAMDKVGIAVTSLCAIHCIMLPVLLPVLPLLGLTSTHNHAFERIILLITMVLGFITIFAGFHRYHRKLYPFYSLFIGGFIYWQKDLLGHEYEHYVLIVGASFVVLAHILNLRLCNQCHSCENH
jgi:hypothetical protein